MTTTAQTYPAGQATTATHPSAPAAPPRRLLRSTGAVLAGFFAVVILSLGTDQLLHVLGVYPPWGVVMRDTRLYVLALTYRCVYSVIGSYLAAALAPRNPMRHAVILGVIGLPPSIAGVIAATKMDLGPLWYPVAIVVAAVPCAWIGGVLYDKVRRS
jgi:hypothetical protein